MPRTGVQMKHRDIPEKTPPYQSYIVRCWQEHSVHAGREIKVWRYSLQNSHTKRRRGFATLEAMLVSLQEELDKSAEAG